MADSSAKRKRAEESEIADADLLAMLPERAALEAHRMLHKYTEEEKIAVVRVLEAVGGNKKHAIRVITTKAGYERIQPSILRAWCKSTTPKKNTGRPVNMSYEAFVFASLEKGVDEPWAAIRDIATLAQSLLPWATDETVQRLKFTDKWILGMLTRQALALGLPGPQHRRLQAQAAAAAATDSHLPLTSAAGAGASLDEGGHEEAEEDEEEQLRAMAAADELVTLPPFDESFLLPPPTTAACAGGAYGNDPTDGRTGYFAYDDG